MFRQYLLYITVIGVMVGCGHFQNAAKAEPAPEEIPQLPRVERVVFMIIDGLDEKALKEGLAPNIAALGEYGTRLKDVPPVLPERGRPAVGTVLSGLEPARHGYIDSEDTLSGATLVDKARAKGYQTVLLDGSGGGLAEAGKRFDHYYKDNFQGKDRLVMDLVVNELAKDDVFLQVIFLPQLRAALERHGRESGEYKEAAADCDNQVGRLVHHLHQSGRQDGSLLVICGISGSPPVIIKGTGIRSGAQVPGGGLADLAPTVAKLTGLESVQGPGLVLWDVLQPGTYSHKYLLEQRLYDLGRAYGEARWEIYRMQEEKILVEKSQSRMASEKGMVLKELDSRDRQIEKLELRIKLQKYAGAFLLLASILLGIFEYRYLKKKFLLFS